MTEKKSIDEISIGTQSRSWLIGKCILLLQEKKRLEKIIDEQLIQIESLKTSHLQNEKQKAKGEPEYIKYL